MSAEPVVIAVVVGIVIYVLIVALMPKRFLNDSRHTRYQLQQLERDSIYAYSSDTGSVLRETKKHSSVITRIFLSLPGVNIIWPKIMRAGLATSMDKFLLGHIGLLIALSYMLRKFSFAGFAIALIATLTFAWMFINRRIQKRNIAFLELFPEALDMIVRSVKSGYPLNAAVRIVAENMTPPLSNEFKQVADETTYGSSLIEALQRLSQRVDEPDIRFFVVVLAVQQDVGGNLAEVLTNLSGIIRKRKHLRMKIRALTSEGRSTAWVLGLLPVFEFGAIYYVAPHHLDPLFNTTTGNMILASAVGIVLLGAFIVRQMINMEI